MCFILYCTPWQDINFDIKLNSYENNIHLINIIDSLKNHQKFRTNLTKSINDINDDSNSIKIFLSSFDSYLNTFDLSRTIKLLDSLKNNTPIPNEHEKSENFKQAINPIFIQASESIIKENYASGAALKGLRQFLKRLNFGSANEITQLKKTMGDSTVSPAARFGDTKNRHGIYLIKPTK